MRMRGREMRREPGSEVSVRRAHHVSRRGTAGRSGTSTTTADAHPPARIPSRRARPSLAVTARTIRYSHRLPTTPAPPLLPTTHLLCCLHHGDHRAGLAVRADALRGLVHHVQELQLPRRNVEHGHRRQRLRRPAERVLRSRAFAAGALHPPGQGGGAGRGGWGRGARAVGEVRKGSRFDSQSRGGGGTHHPRGARAAPAELPPGASRSGEMIQPRGGGARRW